MQKKASLWLGLAMLLMLLVGAIAGLYLTRTNQDIRQQAYSGPGNSKPGPGEVEVWCAACGGFWMPKEDFDKGWGCNISAFQRCGFYPQPIKGAGYCDLNGCDGKGECTVNRYHCDRNTNVGNGCQDTVTATSKGRVNFAASCGTEQIDVSCGDDPGTDFVSKIYPTACGAPTVTPPVTKTPTPPTPPPPPKLACGAPGCNTNSDCAGNSICVQTLTGNKYCSQAAYQSACAANPSQQTCCQETHIGPQCQTITMYEVGGAATPVTDDDDENFIPGETTVRFVCAANVTLPAGYEYRYRVWGPEESDHHTTPKELVAATGGSEEYTLEFSGDYAAQCAVCQTGNPSSCDWENYTPH